MTAKELRDNPNRSGEIAPEGAEISQIPTPEQTQEAREFSVAAQVEAEIKAGKRDAKGMLSPFEIPQSSVESETQKRGADLLEGTRHAVEIRKKGPHAWINSLRPADDFHTLTEAARKAHLASNPETEHLDEAA